MNADLIRERAQRAAMEAAEQQMLADMDTFSEWLTCQCYQAPAFELHSYEAKQVDATEMTSAQLLAIALQHPSEAFHALYELRERYIRDHTQQIRNLAADAVEAIAADLRTPEEA